METTTKFHHSQTTGGVAPSYLHTLQGSNSGQKGEILLDFFGPPLGPDEDEDVNYGYVVVPLFSLKPLKILKKTTYHRLDSDRCRGAHAPES